MINMENIILLLMFFSPILLLFIIVAIARIIHGKALPTTTTNHKDSFGITSNPLDFDMQNNNPFMIGTKAWEAWGIEEEYDKKFYF